MMMNSADYYTRRTYHPDEIGGAPRWLTGEEVDAWRTFIAGGHMTRRQRFIVQQIAAERQQPPAPDPAPVSVTVNVDQPVAPVRRSWGTIAAVIGVVNLFGIILAEQLIEQIAPIAVRFAPYIMIATIAAAAAYLYFTLKDRFDDPFV